MGCSLRDAGESWPLADEETHEDLRISLTRSTTGNDDGENGSGAFASKPSHWNHFPDRKLPCCGSTLSPLPRYLVPLRRGFFLRLDMTERLLRRCPIPKTTRKAPSGVRTSSHATNGIAAFAVSASCVPHHRGRRRLTLRRCAERDCSWRRRAPTSVPRIVSTKSGDKRPTTPA